MYKDQRKRTNQVGVLANLDSDEHFLSLVNLRTGPNDEEARFVVDRNNVAEKYGISKDRSYPKLSSVEQGPLVQFSPEKNEALSTKDPMICGAARVTDKAEPGDVGQALISYGNREIPLGASCEAVSPAYEMFGSMPDPILADGSDAEDKAGNRS
ncbi:hypothetical protein U1Q18_031327 [Sarracenia purpurea var. burkii]